jgi:predicted HTH domain antitoxin
MMRKAVLTFFKGRSLRMIIVIPDDIAQTAGITEEGILLEVSISLLKQRKILLTDAACLARMEQAEFLQLLTERLISTPYNAYAVQESIDQMRKQGW